MQCACFRASDWKVGKCPLFPTLYLQKRAGTRVAPCSVRSAASHKQLEGLKKRCCPLLRGPSSPVSNSDHHKCLATARHCGIPGESESTAQNFLLTYFLNKNLLTVNLRIVSYQKENSQFTTDVPHKYLGGYSCLF